MSSTPNSITRCSDVAVVIAVLGLREEFSAFPNVFQGFHWIRVALLQFWGGGCVWFCPPVGGSFKWEMS